MNQLTTRQHSTNMPAMKPIVYLMEFASGKCYVGATCDFKERRRRHRRLLRTNSAPSKLQAEYNSSGEPTFRAVASGFDRATLHELEHQAMESFQPELNAGPAKPLPRSTRKPRESTMPKQALTCTHNGVTRTWRDWVKVLGLSESAVRSRLFKLKWTMEQALEFEPRPEDVVRDENRAAAVKRVGRMGKAVSMEYQGITDTLRGHCRRLGVDYDRIYGRYRRGWPLEKVFE